MAAIFADIFDAGFPIRSMKPIEEFGGDDNASMAADNTSAYNCRSAGQANAAAADSPHANGRAVDINPRENPWLDPRCNCFMPTAKRTLTAPREGQNPRRRQGLEGLYEAGLDLAGHRHPGLSAFRYRLPVASDVDRWIPRRDRSDTQKIESLLRQGSRVRSLLVIWAAGSQPSCNRRSVPTWQLLPGHVSVLCSVCRCIWSRGCRARP